MGRWTQYDEDDYRLPDGMKRVGYDADTQRYTFQRGNQLWLGEPGVEYGGHLTRAGTAPQDGSPPVHSNRKANLMILPFILLVCVFLLFVWRFIVSDATPTTPERVCGDGSEGARYNVQAGDSCWGIAQSHGTTLEALLNETLNPGLDCNHLKPGDVLCLPPQSSRNMS